MRVRVNGGGHVAQIYAIRQAISKALVSYYQKCKWTIIYIILVSILKIFWFILYRCWWSQQERNQRYFNSVW